MIKTALFGVIGATMLFNSNPMNTPKNIADNGSIDLNRVYTDVMLITDVEELEDYTFLLTLEDCNGNMWQYETDGDDYFIDDCVAVLMDNMNTVSIYDDEIIGVNYSAWTLTK